MGGSTKSIGAQLSGDKLVKNVATGGMYGQADVLSSGISGKGIEDSVKGLMGGGGPAKAATPSPNLTAPPMIDPNKYVNAAPKEAPQAQTFTMAPTTLDQTASNESRTYQDFLAKQLQQQASGQGPSLAQGQFQNNLDQSIAAQHAMAASATGGNIGLAQRQAAVNTGNLNLQAANQAAQLRMQEQLAAEGLLGTTAGTMRGQDLGAATTQAGLTQDTGKFNAGALQQGSQFNTDQKAKHDALVAEYVKMGLTAEGANQAAIADMNRTSLGATDLATKVDIANAASKNAATAGTMKTLGTLGGAAVGMFAGGPVGAAAGATAGGALAGGMAEPASTAESANYLPATPNAGYSYPTAYQSAGMDFSGAMNPTGQPTYNYMPAPSPVATSDERAKKDIKPGDRDMKSFLDALAPHTYEYKRKSDGEGPHTSVMAQELEKTPMGARMVKAAPDGTKQVDYGEGLATMTAAMAYLNDRLNTIESGKKSAAVSKLKGGKK